ncbi:ATP-binding protein [Anaerobium acetethylicum]|uniref:Uncharacterized protein n=1 Tax=Anaerobium acetethylicum TaxID=1619234 RepID=A0A1D3TUR2_9FIRM|nr:hypothetical protein [Anaerobium acetethylicum]SCP97797.1 hypothetical protein SAMN05421730_10144 [Anaerobium acetethylicum]
MRQSDARVEEVKRQAFQTKNKLLNKQILSEEECKQLKTAICNLIAEEIHETHEMQGERRGMDIDELLAEFNEYANRSKSILESMLALVSQGRIPGNEDRKEFETTIEELCKKYDSVCAMAREELLEDELPETGSPVLGYYEAIKNSKSALLRNQMNEVKVTLERFISVQSLLEQYSSALEPFQKQAETLLERIVSSEVTDFSEVSEEVAGPQLFLRALDFDDLDSAAGNDLLDSLEAYYPSRVARGLSKESYFLPGSDSDEVTQTAENAQEVPGTSTSEEGTTAKEEKTSEEEQAEEIASDIETKIAIADNETTEDRKASEEENEEHSEFTKSIAARGLILDEKKDFGILLSDISEAENKKISVSVFLNDLRKGNVKAFKSIIQQLSRFGLISKSILGLRFHMQEGTAESSLDFLQKKGYLRKYKLIPGGEFYCSSPRLEKSLTYKDASKFVEVRQLSVDTMGVLIEDKESSATARMAFLNLYINSNRNFIERQVKKQSATNILFAEAFLYRAYDTDHPEESEILAGAFWTGIEECDRFIAGLEKLIEGAESVNRLIIASANKDFAKNIVEEIQRCNFSKLKNVPIYLYTVSDDVYYSYYTGNEASIGEIWHALADADHEHDDPVESDPEPSFEAENEDDHDTAQDTDTEGQGKPERKAVEKTRSVSAKKESAQTTKIAEAYDTESMEVTLCRLINEKKYYCAPAYARARSLKDSSMIELYDRIAYALNDPMKRCTYSADGVFDLIPQRHTEFSDALVVAIGLRTFFSNQVRYDYNIKAFYNAIKEYPVLSTYPSLSNVVYKLVEFKDAQKKGLDAYADYRAKSISQLEDELKKLQREAKLFFESTIAVKKVEKANLRRFLETKKLLFDVNGDIGQYIKAVADNEKEIQPLIVEFLQDNFIREGNIISEDTIDSDLLWEFILNYWDQAGEKMMMKLRADLKSHLRNNIVNITTKAVQIMIRWCSLVDKINDQTEDASSLAYRKIRKPLIADIAEALDYIGKDINAAEVSDEEKAGLEVIRYTLDEIGHCIDGSYEEYQKRYFYVPFLFTDDVLLDEAFCPDLDVRSSEMVELQPEYRILEHAGKVCKRPMDRCSEILEDGGDDYGSARLLAEYIEATDATADIASIERTIEAGEEYAKETANLRKEQFIGDLELAQSYGQIDNSNSTEDKKEKILQIVDAWYESSLESSNYGFFKRITDSYLAEIRKESKSREKDLIEQLEAFKNTSIKGISAEAKEKKVARIQAAIKQQNYTVSEDLLARVWQQDDEHEEIIEEDFLREFLENYTDYYKPVAMSQSSFATLVSSRTRNKEERGGKRLADNWLPGGSNLGKDRLIALLSGFGFKVNNNSVQAQSSIGKFENFLVRNLVVQGGKRENYTHPIAAFGSGASQEGFRVVCINGKYDAAGLIDVMKQIGNAKHTMILLDCALDKPERRILARKSKSELGDKLFAVVDRTVMMYMVRNYDETKANRMLISLITPFGYYQPYVWESSNVMPPEIFMGRKHELERIESATGANIVYGGRQLGKSALLKKAKADIDGDENGDRAVLIEIKGLNYQEAAKKIGHALYDEGVLTSDITTTDWDELARAVKNRLQSEKNRIPYLLLLLDEADTFIESCEEINYRPFDSLKEIQSIGVGRFKFVIAGLRNIVRFKHEAALGNNSVLTHLEAMTVKPFQPAEARELMEIPLHYLGLKFPKENESLITLILASTNYFPGLIQMYCAKLLSAMRSKDYAGYDEADTPIYEISEEHIKKVLADPEFMDQIREKYVITLKLDEDNYYYLIALIMAFLYHNNGYNEGYSADDIKNAGNELDIAKISNLEDTKLAAFMEELKELNVLRSTDETRYLFTRFTFFQMMGTRTEIDSKLEEYMED